MILLKKLLFLGVIFILFSACSNEQNKYPHYYWTKYPLIAHAGGGIDGYEYTNSKEAILKSYDDGFRLFELDLSLTSDNQLVLRHGWDEAYGQDFLTINGPVSYDQFMNSPYYNEYTPIDFESVLKFLKKNPDVYVIMDGKVNSVEDTKVLYEKIDEYTNKLDKQLKSRLIPQMFYKDDLEIIRQYGFHDLVYVVGREDYTPESLAQFCDENDIRVVSLSIYRANPEVVHALKEKNIKAYVYTINSIDEMEKFLQIGVNGFFTDFVSPQEFNNLRDHLND